MAVSRSLRYQILRRDNHTCRYCGRSAPEVPMQVDHVIPEALGGSDEPGNLVAACQDCNAGKAATPPDAPLVADVADDALRWARALEAASALREEEQEETREFVRTFDAAWGDWGHGTGELRQRVERPADWERSVRSFYRLGLDPAFLLEAVCTAMTMPKLRADNVFRYFAGICWREVGERRKLAQKLIADGDHGADDVAQLPAPEIEPELEVLCAYVDRRVTSEHRRRDMTDLEYAVTACLHTHWRDPYFLALYPDPDALEAALIQRLPEKHGLVAAEVDRQTEPTGVH